MSTTNKNTCIKFTVQRQKSKFCHKEGNKKKTGYEETEENTEDLKYVKTEIKNIKYHHTVK